MVQHLLFRILISDIIIRTLLLRYLINLALQRLIILLNLIK